MARDAKVTRESITYEQPDDYEDYDVIVVGSGVAGLTAAYNILRRNLDINVLVLEGNDNIGGRLAVLDATRGFFIDRRQPHVNKLINELGLSAENKRTVRNEDTVYYTRNGPIVRLGNMFNEIRDFVDRLDLTAKRIDFNSEDPRVKKLAKMSVDALINKYIAKTEAQHFMRAMSYAICGVESTAVSALWFFAMSFGAGGLGHRISFALGNNHRQFIPGGACEIVKKLGQAVKFRGGNVRSNSVVRTIELDEYCAYVTLDDGEQYKCERVVIAVPPPANSRIKILPPNERITRIQASHEIGKGTFFLASFLRPWWMANNFTGDVLAARDSRAPLRLVYEATCPPTRSPFLLAGFLGNPRKPDDPLDFLDSCWSRETQRNNPPKASGECTSYAQWKWPGENKKSGIIEGGYPMSVVKPCRLEDQTNPMLVPHERVYWACSEYAQQWPGTLDGAVEAGESAAFFILFQLRPQSLNGEELRFVTRNGATKDHDLATKSKLGLLRFLLMGIVTSMMIYAWKPVKC